jgi:NADPH:quinone reductase-like Zn-dependent oxidoreductase
MSYPKTYRAWRRSTTPYPRTLVLSTETLPDEFGARDVLIRIHAVSLNYRDVAMLREGGYPVEVEDGGVSGSDCAAEVVAIGSEVTKFELGDRVAPTVDLLGLTGEERVFEEKTLVKLPKHLSWEEVHMARLFLLLILSD